MLDHRASSLHINGLFTIGAGAPLAERDRASLHLARFAIAPRATLLPQRVQQGKHAGNKGKGPGGLGGRGQGSGRRGQREARGGRHPRGEGGVVIWVMI